MAGQRPEGPSGRASNEEVRAHVEEGSVDIEMQAGGPGASRADLLSHRHPASSAAGGGDGGRGGAANGSAVAQDGSVGSGSGTPPATRTDSKGLQSSEADSEEAAEIKPASYWEITKHFGLLGWTAFGGPAAHVSMFLQLFVEKLHWTTHLVFTELLMLGQCMPGPTSTQMAFAIGVLKKGLSGGLLSGMLFQAPGLIILTILGWAASKVLDTPPAWLSGVVAGLAAAGIALVASAAKELVGKICKGRLLQVLCVAAGVISFYYPKPWTFPSVIVAGGLITIIFMRNEVIKVTELKAGVEKLGFNKFWGSVLLASWIVVLVVVLILSGGSEYASHKELHWFAAFYRTGSVIFGGGQVVLPMLFNDVVDLSCPTGESSGAKCVETDQSWMTQNQFYAGLALAQAMPGPLFNFAAYLGAVIAQNAGIFALLGVVICWVALFAPGIILIFGILPWWGMFRQWQVYRRALPGLNSTAVGLIVTSVFQLTLSAYKSSPFPNTSICIGILAFGATEILAIPAPLVVLGGGVLGVLGWGADMN